MKPSQQFCKTTEPELANGVGLYQKQTSGGNVGSRLFFFSLTLLSLWAVSETGPGTGVLAWAESRACQRIQREMTCTADDLASSTSGPLVEHQWRLTRFGWQSRADWEEKHLQPLTPWAIHPLLWAPALVLLLFLVLIWTTEEWEFDQMFPAATADNPAAAGTGKC